MNDVKSDDTITIFTPMNGDAVELAKVNDPIFSSGMLGKVFFKFDLFNTP